MSCPVAMVPGYERVLAVGFLGASILAVVLVNVARGFKSRESRARMAWSALILGPSAGVALAALVVGFGDLNPLDYAFTFWTYTTVGGIAGFFLGAVFALSALGGEPAARGSQEKKPAESVDGGVWDPELDR